MVSVYIVQLASQDFGHFRNIHPRPPLPSTMTPLLVHRYFTKHGGCQQPIPPLSLHTYYVQSPMYTRGWAAWNTCQLLVPQPLYSMHVTIGRHYAIKTKCLIALLIFMQPSTGDLSELNVFVMTRNNKAHYLAIWQGFWNYFFSWTLRKKIDEDHFDEALIWKNE